MRRTSREIINYETTTKTQNKPLQTGFALQSGADDRATDFRLEKGKKRLLRLSRAWITFEKGHFFLQKLYFDFFFGN